MATLLTLSPYATDWLNLLTRWLHVIAGIVWIGSSFYFIALDNHLRPPKDADEGVGGEEVVRDGHLVRGDESEIAREQRRQAERFAA